MQAISVFSQSTSKQSFITSLEGRGRMGGAEGDGWEGQRGWMGGAEGDDGRGRGG